MLNEIILFDGFILKSIRNWAKNFRVINDGLISRTIFFGEKLTLKKASEGLM